MKKLRLAFLALCLIIGAVRLQAQTFNPHFVDGELYFKVKDTFSGNITLAHPLMAQLVALYSMDTCYKPFEGLNNDTLNRTYRLKFSQLNKTQLCMDTLRTLAFVDYVEQAPLYKTDFTPNDLQGQQWSLVKINAQAAWNATQGSASVIIAIVDNGVLLTHEDIAPNLWVNTGEVAGNLLDDDLNGFADDRNGYDVADHDGNPSPKTGITGSDPWNHGTHCAGIASGATNNGKGIASIGFKAKIMAIKCTKTSAAGNELTNAIDGITYAVRNNADIISMSFGSDGSSISEQLVINTARNKGIVMISAAGNDNVATPFFPASYDGVINVGATDESDAKASFSNYGPTVDIMAPGTSILSTLASSNTDYGFFGGTSMSCPMVAGLASLVLAQHPTFTPDQVTAQLKNNADNIDGLNPGFAGKLGAGRINAAKTVGASTAVEEIVGDSNIKVYPNPFTDIVTIETNSDVAVQIEWMDMEGRTVQTVPASAGITSISSAKLLNGMYLLKIAMGDKISYHRVVKM